MTLEEFLAQLHAEIRAETEDRLAELDQSTPGEPADGYPHAELVFAEKVMQHMAEIGMTFEPQVCHFSAKVANANLRLSGYAFSEDSDQLDLFVTEYLGTDELQAIADSVTKSAATQCVRFLGECAKGRLADRIDPATDAYALTQLIHASYPKLDQLRIYVLTDRQAKSKAFRPADVSGKTVKLEVMDIERLYRHWSEGKPRDELVANFPALCGGPLPCVYVPDGESDYAYALAAIPGSALRELYDRHGARLLEANVRSFLSTTKANKGIRDTLVSEPHRFMAYNNGVVIVADSMSLMPTPDGGPGIGSLTGLQIVNGGQTTASIYFTQKKEKGIDLSKVRVPAKIIVLNSDDPVSEEALIADISKYANTQNSVKQSDLSANNPYHQELERLSQTVFCPDGVGRWFYERAAGSYKTMLAREGATPARLRHLREKVVPPSRKITKTDLAKYVNAWECRPHLVSLGAQKNFERFMDSVRDPDGRGPGRPIPDVSAYKRLVSVGIVYKRAHSLVKPMFQAFQANVAAYLVSLMADRCGRALNLDLVWAKQDVSPELMAQLRAWAPQVNDALHTTANGRMVSEWAKKPECWDAVCARVYKPLASGIPELT